MRFFSFFLFSLFLVISFGFLSAIPSAVHSKMTKIQIEIQTESQLSGERVGGEALGLDALSATPKKAVKPSFPSPLSSTHPTDSSYYGTCDGWSIRDSQIYSGITVEESYRERCIGLGALMVKPIYDAWHPAGITTPNEESPYFCCIHQLGSAEIAKINGIPRQFPSVFPHGILQKPSDNVIHQPLRPRGIVLHGTAGPHAVNYLTSTATPNSAHFVIEMDGTITQLVSLDFWANHNGALSDKSIFSGDYNPNEWTIGIEHTRNIKNNNVMPMAQLKASLGLVEDLMRIYANDPPQGFVEQKYYAIYNQTINNMPTYHQMLNVYLHDEFDYGRICPGPFFPFHMYKDLQKKLFGFANPHGPTGNSFDTKELMA